MWKVGENEEKDKQKDTCIWAPHGFVPNTTNVFPWWDLRMRSENKANNYSTSLFCKFKCEFKI